MAVKHKPILIAASEDFQVPDEGTYTDVEILNIEDLGLKEFNFKGKNKQVLTFEITLQLGDLEYSRFFTNSAHSKGNLYALYKAAMGEAPTAGVDVNAIVGKKVDVTVSQYEEDGKTKVKLTFVRCSSRMSAPKPTTKAAPKPATKPEAAEESDSDGTEITDGDLPF